jgi:hypothetical protein
MDLGRMNDHRAGQALEGSSEFTADTSHGSNARGVRGRVKNLKAQASPFEAIRGGSNPQAQTSNGGSKVTLERSAGVSAAPPLLANAWY